MLPRSEFPGHSEHFQRKLLQRKSPLHWGKMELFRLRLKELLEGKGSKDSYSPSILTMPLERQGRQELQNLRASADIKRQPEVISSERESRLLRKASPEAIPQTVSQILKMMRGV